MITHALTEYDSAAAHVHCCHTQSTPNCVVTYSNRVHHQHHRHHHPLPHRNPVISSCSDIRNCFIPLETKINKYSDYSIPPTSITNSSSFITATSCTASCFTTTTVSIEECKRWWFNGSTVEQHFWRKWKTSTAAVLRSSPPLQQSSISSPPLQQTPSSHSSNRQWSSAQSSSSHTKNWKPIWIGVPDSHMAWLWHGTELLQSRSFDAVHVPSSRQESVLEETSVNDGFVVPSQYVPAQPQCQLLLILLLLEQIYIYTHDIVKSNIPGLYVTPACAINTYCPSNLEKWPIKFDIGPTNGLPNIGSYFVLCTCSLPDVPKPGSRPGTPAQFTPPLSEDDDNPPLKRKWLRRICKQEGHNCRSCCSSCISRTGAATTMNSSLVLMVINWLQPKKEAKKGYAACSS